MLYYIKCHLENIGACFGCHWCAPEQSRVQHKALQRQMREKAIHAHTHTHSYGQFRMTNHAYMQVWVEASASPENPLSHIQTLGRKAEASSQTYIYLL